MKSLFIGCIFILGSFQPALASAEVTAKKCYYGNQDRYSELFYRDISEPVQKSLEGKGYLPIYGSSGIDDWDYYVEVSLDQGLRYESGTSVSVSISLENRERTKIFSRVARGDVNCDSWESNASTYNPFALLLRWSYLCDDNLSREAFIYTRSQEILKQFISQMPDCSAADTAPVSVMGDD